MNIVLIGFMACGKTTVGKALAEKMGMKLLDTDEIIEKQQAMKIEDIFRDLGEAHFRELEKHTIEQLAALDNYVISVGGGAVMYYENLETLKKAALTIFLDAPFPSILNNLHGKYRPLVGNNIDEVKLRELYDLRYSTYIKADLVISTDMLDAQQTTAEIIKKIDIIKQRSSSK